LLRDVVRDDDRFFVFFSFIADDGFNVDDSGDNSSGDDFAPSRSSKDVVTSLDNSAL
jgi:hypothetical protein